MAEETTQAVVEAAAEKVAAAQAAPAEDAAIGPDGNPVVVEAEPAEPKPAEVKPVEAEKPAVPEGYVPVAVVQELREDMRAARTAAEQAQAQVRAYNDRAEAIRAKHAQDEGLVAAQAAVKAEEDAIVARLGEKPDPSINPFEATEWEHKKELALERAAHARDIKRIEGLITGKRDEDALAGIQGMTREFISKNPDYTDAFQHVMRVETRAAEKMGYRSEEAKAQYLESRAKTLAQTAIAEGRNPAADIYEMAKEYGWSPKAAAPAAPVVPVAEKQATKAEGQKVRSLPSGGAESSALPDLETISKMTWAEHSKWYANPKNAAYEDELLKQS